MPINHELTRGNLEMMILSALIDGPLYGYLVQKKIAESTGGQVQLRVGTLYRLLNQLEGAEAIEGQWENNRTQNRKWYRLTAVGKKRLRQQSREWNQYARCIADMLRPVQAILDDDLSPQAGSA